MPLTRDQILQAKDRPSEVVSVPEWGGDVYVGTMSGTERDAWEEDSAKGGNIRAKLVARTVLDENGVRLFTDDDIETLGAKNGMALDRILEVAARMNRLGKKDIEDLAKNSGAGQSAGSGSSSPAN